MNITGKNTTTKNEYFLKSNFVGVNRLFFLIYLNGNIDVKSYKARRYFLPNSTINNYNIIIMIVSGKNFYFILKNCLFGVTNIVRNSDKNKYV